MAYSRAILAWVFFQRAEPLRPVLRSGSARRAAGLFLVLRLLAVTDYDWHGAFSVAGSINVDDAISIMVGTFTADEIISGIALIILLPVLLIHEGRKRRQGQPL